MKDFEIYQLINIDYSVAIVEFWWLCRSDWDDAVCKAVKRNEAG